MSSFLISQNRFYTCSPSMSADPYVWEHPRPAELQSNSFDSITRSGRIENITSGQQTSIPGFLLPGVPNKLQYLLFKVYNQPVFTAFPLLLCYSLPISRQRCRLITTDARVGPFTHLTAPPGTAVAHAYLSPSSSFSRVNRSAAVQPGCLGQCGRPGWPLALTLVSLFIQVLNAPPR